ncbi:MAG: glycerate kinase [Planctomycetaceae bacterium]
MTPDHQLRADATDIWWAGVEAVRADRIVRQALQPIEGGIRIVDRDYRTDEFGRLIVVGAGKAGAGMVRGLEESLAPWLPPDRWTGWVNVPADCVRPTISIHLHAGRPAGVNIPTAAAVAGTNEILRLLAAARPDDIVIVLLSGGGSALLTAPAVGITLADKQSVTALLSARGASISDLNTVRRQLSRVKGGRLLAECSARNVEVLIVSDVIGDPLATIASGPTVPDPTTARDALAVLNEYVPDRAAVAEGIWRLLEAPTSVANKPDHRPAADMVVPQLTRHHVLANNRRACDAAARRAAELGYRVVDVRSDESGVAREVGQHLVQRAREMQAGLRVGDRPLCAISGGEPIVRLVETDLPRLGGRNQELARSRRLSRPSRPTSRESPCFPAVRMVKTADRCRRRLRGSAGTWDDWAIRAGRPGSSCN